MKYIKRSNCVITQCLLLTLNYTVECSLHAVSNDLEHFSNCLKFKQEEITEEIDDHIDLSIS